MGIIQSAIGGQSSSTNLQTTLSPKNSTSDVSESSEPTSSDFYSVIYIFSQPDVISHSVDSRTRGLWHLAKCLLELQDSTPTREVLASPPSRRWNHCNSAAYFLNLSLSSSQTLPQLARLASAYRNLTSVFGKWPDDTGLEVILRGRFKSDQLPPPEFLRKPHPPSLRNDQKSSPVVEGPKKAESKTEQSIETKNPPTPAQSKEPNDQEKPITPVQSSHPPSTSESQEQGTGDQEVVLPAAMGGSWKETMYMRLNNKVLQLQSDVSVSMRYLEELSQSYKRQTERLSASFNLTTAWLKATAKGAEERDLLQQERIDALEAQLTKLLQILAEQGFLIIEASNPTNLSSSSDTDSSSSSSSSTVPEFRRPFPTSSSPYTGDFKSNFWSALFHFPLIMTSKVQNPEGDFCGITTASPNTCTNDLEGDRKPSNSNAALPLVKKSAKVQQGARPASTDASKSAKPSSISPQAVLLLNGRRQRSDSEDKKDIISALWDFDYDSWRFLLVVSARHLRNFVLSDTFKMLMMHTFFALVSHLLVYTLFLRRILKKFKQVAPVEGPMNVNCMNQYSGFLMANGCGNGFTPNQLINLEIPKPVKPEEISWKVEEEEEYKPALPSTEIDEKPSYEEFLRQETVIDEDDSSRVVRHRKLSPKIEAEADQKPLANGNAVHASTLESVMPSGTNADVRPEFVCTSSKSSRKRQKQKQKKR